MYLQQQQQLLKYLKVHDHASGCFTPGGSRLRRNYPT